ncbi:MAG: TonB-dependent receptor plug domain-containing protein [Bacteroidota bacterium]
MLRSCPGQLWLLLFILPIYVNANTHTDYTITENIAGSTVVISPVDTLSPEGLVQDIGYDHIPTATIGTAQTSLRSDQFNSGLLSDPLLLIQGRFAGLQFNRRGADPNQNSITRLRGTSLSAIPSPLIVIDGIISADLQQLDPNDVAEITLLKDASATAIYGMRAAGGALLIRTKLSTQNTPGWRFSYRGQSSVSDFTEEVPILNADQFRSIGGTDLGASTDWPNEITRSAWSQAHSVAANFKSENTRLRFSNTYRNVEGILNTAGFSQWNSRLKVQTSAGVENLQINLDGAFTHRASEYGFLEAFYYATTYNPTAPVRGNGTLQFPPEQFGDYFEQIGLFDAFNPVSVLEQNSHAGRNNGFTFGMSADYQLNPSLSISTRAALQSNSIRERAYYPVTSLFRGNAASPTRRGQADYLDFSTNFFLVETYGTYQHQTEQVKTTVVLGLSHQGTNAEFLRQSFVGFDDLDFDFRNTFDAPVLTSDILPFLGSAEQSIRPEDRFSAALLRVGQDWSNGLFAQASFRAERPSRATSQTSLHWLYGLAAGIDLNERWQLSGVDYLKLRMAAGLNRSFPYDWTSPAQSTAVTGATPISVISTNSPELIAERHQELNFGLDFASQRFRAAIDVYDKYIYDLILLGPAGFGVDPRYENQGGIHSQGVEVTLDADLFKGKRFGWNMGVIFSTYNQVLEEFTGPGGAQVRANPGSPGLNGGGMILIREGEELGQIWGPVFAGVNMEGAAVFEDLNGDGVIIGQPSEALNPQADFQVLGNGLPDYTLTLTQRIRVGKWSLQALFRGVFGHSLVNTRRMFYENRFSPTPVYNQVVTDLAAAGLQRAHFSSLYVEEADFIQLDNISLSRSFELSAEKNHQLTFSITGENLWRWTNYTGLDPEPAFLDYGTASGVEQINSNLPDLGSPGIDRRYSYWPAQTVTFGLRLDL